MENLLNKKELLEKVFWDKELLNQIIDMFLEMFPDMMASIEESIKNADSESLVRAAHSFKGSVGNFSRHGAFEQAVELETIGKSQDLRDAPQVFQTMQKEVNLLVHALEEFRLEVSSEAD